MNIITRIFELKNELYRKGYEPNYLLISEDNLELVKEEIKHNMALDSPSVRGVRIFLGMEVILRYGENILEVTSNKPCARCFSECSDSDICHTEFCYHHHPKYK